MTKRDQQILFWTLSLLCVGGMLVMILSSGAQGQAQVMIGGVEIGAAMAKLLVFAGVVFVLLLIVATILMPLYVVSIHGHLKRLREQMEKLQWYAQKHHEREERKGRER